MSNLLFTGETWHANYPFVVTYGWVESMALSDEEKRAYDRARGAKWRAENIEHARELDRIKARRLAARKRGVELTEEELLRPIKPLLTEDEKREKRRLKSAKQRAENPEYIRKITRDSMRKTAAERAIAEGRIPGKKGPPKKYTEEEKRAKRRAKNAKWTENNTEVVRERARLREAAKRRGTFVSKALPRLTEEERRLTEVAWAATRRARKRAAGGTYTREDITALYNEQAGLCAICTEPFREDGFHIDHWIPLARGGTNDPSNLKLTHPTCNLKKGAKLPEELGLVPSAATEKGN